MLIYRQFNQPEYMTVTNSKQQVIAGVMTPCFWPSTWLTGNSQRKILITCVYTSRKGLYIIADYPDHIPSACLLFPFNTILLIAFSVHLITQQSVSRYLCGNFNQCLLMTFRNFSPAFFATIQIVAKELHLISVYLFIYFSLCI